METGFHSLLYSEPRLYDLVFPDAGETTARMCCEGFRRYLTTAPASVLDVGCGTGRQLEALARAIPECWGVDLLDSNVAYARATRPQLRIVQGDMRSVRLGRTFDLITSFGNAVSYALRDDDLTRTVETLAVHANRGTLLILDALNARSYLDGDGFQKRIEGHVDVPGFRATSVSTHVLDRANRILKRARVWHIVGRSDVEDYAEYRLLHPDELVGLLEAGGFEVLGLFDNREFRSSELTGRITASADVSGMRGRKLYAFALFRH